MDNIVIIILLYYDKQITLTLLEAASGMHPEWQGGAFKLIKTNQNVPKTVDNH